MNTSLEPATTRAARTRAALLDAGLEIFAERPVDAVAIDQIVARAGVAKGSFFNHFADKPGFAAAIADAIRADLEGRVAAANGAVADPFERLANGMAVAAEFALDERRSTLVMLRAASHLGGVHHPLNEGVSADMAAAAATGRTRSGAAEWGVLYWLGLCQVLMADIAARAPDRSDVAHALRGIAQLGLSGLGAGDEAARKAATNAAFRLRAD